MTQFVHVITSKDQLNQLVLSNNVIAKFTARWCGPCKTIAPAFKKIAETETNCVFVEIDVDDNPTLSEYFNITAMPTFVHIVRSRSNGGLYYLDIKRLQKGTNEDALRSFVRKVVFE
jgi:thiol-disulfide isomerase/thioredoxin